MTVGVRTTGAWVAGSTSIATSFPTGIADGDMMILFVGCKPYSATITDVSGWTRMGTQQTNGTTANGTDSGSVAWTAYYRIKQAADSAPTVSITSGNTALATIVAFTKTGPTWNTPTAYFGSDTSSGTGYSITAASSSGNITAGDGLAFCTIIAGNNSSFGSPTISATSLTVGTVTENPATEGSTNTGLDCGASIATALPSAGTASADAVCGWTLGTAQTGGSALVRIREGGYTDVTKADPTTTGSAVTLEQQFGFTDADPTIAGTAVGVSRMSDIAALSVTGQTIALDVVISGYTLDFDQAALSVSGSTLTLDTVQEANPASLSVTGQTVGLSEGLFFSLDPAAVTVQGSDLSWGFGITVVEASLATNGSSLYPDLGLGVSPATDLISGSTIDLDILVGYNLAFDPATPTVTGVSVGVSKPADSAGLTIQGQDVSLSVEVVSALDVTPAELSISGTAVGISKASDPASLTVSGSVVGLQTYNEILVDPALVSIRGVWVDMGFNLRYIDVGKATLTFDTQWVDIEQDRDFAEAWVDPVGSEFSWGFGVNVTQADITPLTQSVTLGFDPYVTVDSASLTVQGIDVNYILVGVEPYPDLNVDARSLSIVGQNIDLQIPPLEVESASLTIVGREQELGPPGSSNTVFVEACSIGVECFTIEFLRGGTLSEEVTAAALVLEGQIVGVDRGVYGSNEGRIDGYTEYIINQPNGGVLMYPKGGGYYVISS